MRLEHDETIGESPAIHIARDVDDPPASEWAVWLNPDRTPYTGLCLAVGASREAVISEAAEKLERVLETLQGPTTDALRVLPV